MNAPVNRARALALLCVLAVASGCASGSTKWEALLEGETVELTDTTSVVPLPRKFCNAGKLNSYLDWRAFWGSAEGRCLILISKLDQTCRTEADYVDLRRRVAELTDALEQHEITIEVFRMCRSIWPGIVEYGTYEEAEADLRRNRPVIRR